VPAGIPARVVGGGPPQSVPRHGRAWRLLRALAPCVARLVRACAARLVRACVARLVRAGALVVRGVLRRRLRRRMRIEHVRVGCRACRVRIHALQWLLPLVILRWGGRRRLLIIGQM
jgi:hypothetical protein